ncbi:MAG TPA: DUF2905 domain-containing protein [Pirellulales bacterium]|nr:DUF2905 domain-containing protein [Pirellulales bacterium]
MNTAPNFGWMLIVGGLALAAIGAIWLFGPSIPWLGHLPGDIHIDRGNTKFYFPLTTCILLSVAVSLILWLVRLFSR